LTTACTGWFSKLNVTAPSPVAAVRGVLNAVGWIKLPVPLLMSGLVTRSPLLALMSLDNGSGAGTGFCVPAMASRCNAPSSRTVELAQPTSHTAAAIVLVRRTC